MQMTMTTTTQTPKITENLAEHRKTTGSEDHKSTKFIQLIVIINVNMRKMRGSEEKLKRGDAKRRKEFFLIELKLSKVFRLRGEICLSQ